MEIQISRDIRKFKTKDIGNFSFKEAGFLAGGLAVGFVIYNLTQSLETAIPFAGIILIFGFFKPYGMSMTQFIRTVVREKLTTQCYINETDFEYNYDEFKELYGDDIHFAIPTDEVIQTKGTEQKGQDKASVKINKQDNERIIR